MLFLHRKTKVAVSFALLIEWVKAFSTGVSLLRINMKNEVNSTSPTLLMRIRDRNDNQSWTTFCEIYSPMLYDYCRRRGLQPSDSSDVVQEVLIRVAHGIRNLDYDRSRGRFRGWLATIVHREISRFFAKSTKDPSVELLEDIEEDDPRWGEHFQAYILRVALERIRPHFSNDTWTAFDLVWVNGETPKLVAQKMKRGLDFVYLSKSRVLNRLRLEVDLLAEEAGI